MPKSFIEIARVGSEYRLNGELKLYPLASSIETLLSYGDWYIQNTKRNSWQILKGESVYRRASKIYIKLADADCVSAKKYVNALIGVPVNVLPKLPKDEVYFKDIIGCEVVNNRGELFGQVVDIIETEANEILVCRHGQDKYLIPYIKQYIVSQSIKLKKIIVDWEYDY